MKQATKAQLCKQAEFPLQLRPKKSFIFGAGFFPSGDLNQIKARAIDLSSTREG
jgi:hypothetical protein